MADLNPIAAWRRLLALPNESRTKTIAMAILVSAVCAVLVSAATVMLRPIQAANRAALEQARLEALVAGIPGMTDLLQDSGGELVTVVIDLGTGAAAREVTPATLDAALADTANWTVLTPAQDSAGLGARPDYAQVFMLRQGERIELVLLPMSGTGYGGRIDAIMALHGDMHTIAGLTVTNHSETPGLGARITEPAWQGHFPGTRAVDDAGAVRFAVARGPAATEFEVDGITGATRTGTGVTQMVRFWLGPYGYGPFLGALRRGEF